MAAIAVTSPGEARPEWRTLTPVPSIELEKEHFINFVAGAVRTTIQAEEQHGYSSQEATNIREMKDSLLASFGDDSKGRAEAVFRGYDMDPEDIYSANPQNQAAQERAILLSNGITDYETAEARAKAQQILAEHRTGAAK